MAGVYIHIPFCRSKCHYCNFFSVASIKHKEQIVNTIIKEIEFKKDCINDSIDTIYFGGGTPSILNSSELNSILNAVFKYFTINNAAEICLEANPDNVIEPNLLDWKSMGFNRLSIGIQSFDDEILKKLNRDHGSHQSFLAIESALKHDFKNLNCDIIFGIPGQTNQMLIRDLEKLIDYKIPHISAYSLTVENHTALDLLIKKNKYPKISDNQSVEQFYLCSDFLTQNYYEQYEISNYAKSENFSKHNTNYWKQVPYIGIGPSAHSFFDDKRSWNFASINKYIQQINSGISCEEFEILDAKTKFNEYLMLGLRTMWGIDTEFLKNNYPKYFDQIKHKLDKEIQLNNLKIIQKKLVLSTEAKIVSDGIISGLLID